MIMVTKEGQEIK